VAFVTVLPNNSAPGSVGSSSCGYAQGIEFSIPVNDSHCPPGCMWTPIAGRGALDVSSPSATTEAMSAVLAALKTHHPLWTWGDIKSVLRTTASNWRTGYTAVNPSGPAYGYGNIDFSRADAHAGTIFLQPPGLVVRGSATADLVLYPFMSSRRSGEVIYAFQSPPTGPSPRVYDEYTYSQIAALVRRYRGRLVHQSNGASGVQSLHVVLPTKAPVYFVAFTVDNISNLALAHYSRLEAYSALPAIAGAAATRALGPAVSRR
jgi:hypothetical protein